DPARRASRIAGMNESAIEARMIAQSSGARCMLRMRWRRRERPGSGTTNTNYELRITNYGLRITEYEVRVATTTHQLVRMSFPHSLSFPQRKHGASAHARAPI